MADFGGDSSSDGSGPHLPQGEEETAPLAVPLASEAEAEDVIIAGPPPPVLALMKSVSAELAVKGEGGGIGVEGKGEESAAPPPQSVLDAAALSPPHAGNTNTPGGAEPRKELPVLDPRDEPMVVDNGGWTLKAGFGGDDAPRAVFRTTVGHVPPASLGHVNLGSRKRPASILVGDEAHTRHEAGAGPAALTLAYPLERGVVTNWDDMEKVWHHAFYNELRVDPTDMYVLLSEQPLTAKASRERLVSIMFETFHVGGMYISVGAVLALYASGRTTGLVLDSGHDRTYAVPIYEGYALPHAVCNADLGGRHVTEEIRQILALRGVNPFPNVAAEARFLNDMKEKHQQICPSVEAYDAEIQELGGAEGKRDEEEDEEDQRRGAYKLPDGDCVPLGRTRFASEILFRPQVRKVVRKVDAAHCIVLEA